MADLTQLSNIAVEAPSPASDTLTRQPSQDELTHGKRLVIVSNREPYTVKLNEKDHVCLEKTPGGLVSALDPVLRQTQGLWVCWEGATHRIEDFDETPTLSDLADWSSNALPYNIQTVALTEKEINHYYYGYANTRLWPLFHYFFDQCNFTNEEDWPHYEAANQKFADVVVQSTGDDDLIWVQDYQLFLVPEKIRHQAPHRQIAFFNHIPFPAYEVFRLLPRREIILRGMLGAALIGFHIPSYCHHFMECVERLLPPGEVVVDHDQLTIRYQGRTIQIGAFPISIDVQQVEELVQQEALQNKAAELRSSFGVEYLGVGLDRLDYSKGILERLEAIRFFFKKYPQYRKRLTFIQIGSPSRTEVPQYRAFKEQVDQTVGRINGELAEGQWMPIQFFYRTFSLPELLPYFIASDFALVTPIRDGMNLVAKEYCAAKQDLSGSLILSETAGAAYELRQAELVNPYAPEQIADAIHHVLTRPAEMSQAHMSQMRQVVAQYDIHQWVSQFLRTFLHVIDRQASIATHSSGTSPCTALLES